MGLCRFCASDDVRDFMNDALRNFKQSGVENCSVHIGSWVDLQSRTQSCRLCDAVVSLLREAITERLPSIYPRMVKEEATCGLRRHMSPHGPPLLLFADGYARIAIEVAVQFWTYTGRETVFFELTDA